MKSVVISEICKISIMLYYLVKKIVRHESQSVLAQGSEVFRGANAQANSRQQFSDAAVA